MKKKITAESDAADQSTGIGDHDPPSATLLATEKSNGA
jgi:hypothetical protein